MFTTKLKVAVAAISMALLSPGITSAASPAAGSADLSVAESCGRAGTEFSAVFANFGTGQYPSARLDVAVDTAVAPVGSHICFVVSDVNGVHLAEFPVPTNDKGFASSASAPAPYRNLFRLTNGQPGMVRAYPPAGASLSTAVLQQRGTGNRLVLGVPATVTAYGTPLGGGKYFSVAVPDVPAAALLIGNVSDSDVHVDVFVGTPGAPGQGKHSNLRIQTTGQWRVDLEQVADENAHLIVQASDRVIVQLVLGDERVSAVTLIPAG